MDPRGWNLGFLFLGVPGQRMHGLAWRGVFAVPGHAAPKGWNLGFFINPKGWSSGFFTDPQGWYLGFLFLAVPGQRMRHRCTASADTVCVPCQDGYFSSQHHHGFCQSCTICNARECWDWGKNPFLGHLGGKKIPFSREKKSLLLGKKSLLLGEKKSLPGAFLREKNPILEGINLLFLGNKPPFWGQKNPLLGCSEGKKIPVFEGITSFFRGKKSYSEGKKIDFFGAF